MRLYISNKDVNTLYGLLLYLRGQCPIDEKEEQLLDKVLDRFEREGATGTGGERGPGFMSFMWEPGHPDDTETINGYKLVKKEEQEVYDDEVSKVLEAIYNKANHNE